MSGRGALRLGLISAGASLAIGGLTTAAGAAPVAEPLRALAAQATLSAGVVRLAQANGAPPLPSRAPRPGDSPRQAEQPAPEAEEAAPAPQVATPPAPASADPVPVRLTARLTEDASPLTSGLIWRIFEAAPDDNGRHTLLDTHREANPTVELPPGNYLINASYGLSNFTRSIIVQPGRSSEEQFVLNAGGLRLSSALTTGDPLPDNDVRYDIYADEADQFGNRENVLSEAKPGVVLRLNAGVYHIVSVYGDANAIVRADVTVEPGRLTDATVNHSAAKVTFRLVGRPGGEALADTRWSVLTPGGDVVMESAGALPTHILAAGDYTVAARHRDVTYERDFTIETGEARQIEVLAR